MEAAVAQVQRLTSGWRHLPDVEVVGTWRDLPGRHDPSVAGLYQRSTVFVVADQPPERVAQVLAHELLAHHGLRVLHGRARWPAFMRAVAAGARQADSTLAAARRLVRCTYGELPVLLEADEVAAVVAESMYAHGVLQETSAPRQRWLAALRHLQREVLLRDVPADLDEVVGSLLQAEDALRDGLHGPAAWCYRPAMPPTKPMGADPPAANLAESEDMLGAERYRLQSREDWKAMAMFAFGAICVLGIVVSVGYWLLLLLGIIRL